MILPAGIAKFWARDITGMMMVAVAGAMLSGYAGLVLSFVAGVPSGPIYNIDQVFADEQVKHLGIAQSVKKKDKSTLTLVGQPFLMSRTKSKIAAPPPTLGQHTDEVLGELLGKSAADIAALRAAGIV